MTGAITFNGYNLQTFTPSVGVGILTNVIKHTDGPEAVFDLLEVANANRSLIGDINSPNKTINIAGVIKGSSGLDLDQRIDALKLALNGRNKNLDLNYAGNTRRYIATAPPNGVKVDEDGTLRAKFSVQFICAEPYGRDSTQTTIINQANYTSASYTATPTIGGSAPYQLPIFTITIDSLTGTDDYLQIINNANNQAILISGQGLANGDVLVIDCEQRIVTLNDIQIDYSGTFLELEPGAASLSYSDGFATRQVDILAKYTKRYS
jgi:phage-related protein